MSYVRSHGGEMMIKLVPFFARSLPCRVLNMIFQVSCILMLTNKYMFCVYVYALLLAETYFNYDNTRYLEYM